MLTLIRRFASPIAFSLSLLASTGIALLLRRPVGAFQNTIGKPDLPDTTLPPVNLYIAAANWSEDTVTLYLTRIAPLDIVFPVALGLTLAFALALLTRADSRLPSLGVFATLIDWAENASFVIILKTLDAPVPGLAPLAMALTLVKFAAYLSGLGIVLFLLGRKFFAEK